MKKAGKFASGRSRQSGFTLVELLIAVVILLVALVALAQLVPLSVLMNSQNRNDGTALVFAQQELEVMRAQPLNTSTFPDPPAPTWTCSPAGSRSLGDPTQPNVLIGGPVVINGAGAPIIDFSAAPVDNYSFSCVDQNDPLGVPYDARWAVITIVNPQNVVTAKRMIIGVFRRGMKSPSLPITLDTLVEK